MDQCGWAASVMSKSSGIANTEMKKEYWNACGGVLGSSSGAGVIKTVVTQNAATTATMQTIIFGIGVRFTMPLTDRCKKRLVVASLVNVIEVGYCNQSAVLWNTAAVASAASAECRGSCQLVHRLGPKRTKINVMV